MIEGPPLDNTLKSKLNTAAPRFKANAAAVLALSASQKHEQAAIRQGGGAKAIEAQHAKNRLTAR